MNDKAITVREALHILGHKQYDSDQKIRLIRSMLRMKGWKKT